MKLRNFLISWRMLIAEPGYSIVIMLGLSLGFAACILLIGLVRHSFSYDDQVPDNSRVYEVYSRFNLPGQSLKWQDGTSLVVRDVVQRTGMAEMASGVMNLPVAARVNDSVYDLGLTAVDPDFGKLIDVRTADGDLQAALSRPDAVALTRDTAQRLYGDVHVVGKTLEIAGKAFQIVAVLENPPAATTVPYAALVGINTAAWSEEDRQESLTKWQAIDGREYIRLKPGISPMTLQEALQNAADQSPVRSAFPVELIAQLGQKKLLEMRVGALRDAYLDPDLLPTVSPLHGDKRAVLGLAVVAALILLMAAANYVNLTIVRTLRRKREIALRKVLGASAQSIVQQFLAESILASLFAAALGSLIATLLLPLFSDLVNRKLDQVFTPTSYLAFGALGIVVGAMAGAYPAWVALQVDIGRALSGRSDSEATGGVWLRRALTVLQFSTAIALTGLALTISWQTRYASTLFPGFDPAPLLVVDLPETLQDPVSRVFRDEALHLPDVSAVTAATSAIGRPDWKTFAIVQRSDAKPTSVEFKGVSNNFFTTHHVSPVAGRLFDERIDPQESASVVVMNAAATNALGFDSPQAALGQFINPPVKGSNFARLSGQAARSSPLQIVGIVPDIRYQNLREPVPALVYVITPLTKVLTVRSRGDASAVKTALEALWQRNFPNNVPKIARAGSFFELNYADDLRLARMLAAAACVAIGIAAFGIYVLSAHSARRRSKEVVLRKLYGANQVAIARLMARELLMLLALGAVGGLPLVAIGGERFLASFVEHASIIPLAMLYALFMAIAVALVATCRHTLIAMRTSPSNVLRY